MSRVVQKLKTYHIHHDISTKPQQSGRDVPTTLELSHRICENLTHHSGHVGGPDHVVIYAPAQNMI